MTDPTVETEIALLKQIQNQLEAQIKQVDENCEARSQHTDAKLDDLQRYLLTTMVGLVVTLAVYILTHAAG